MNTDLIFQAVADAKSELNVCLVELMDIAGIDDIELDPGHATLLGQVFLERVAAILADIYIKNPAKTHLRRYARMKLEADMGI